ncbi:C1 family peptidase [Deinococcus yavapaiensis]|uniref:Papain like protease n=1 Tax=Deinococcus yavapaiensis KR-236 TaxID=694435 RepID=A0A318S6H6_9DEIO|nr:C1 family peptidase [Deinococcus yavapaiensis]PYE49990.1 papain like protease [Deinococcus yavapaiensis KR-236]
MFTRLRMLIVWSAVLLTACGGGPSGTPPPPPLSDPLVQDNAWTGGRVAEAQQVTPEEFRRQVASGELELVSAASLARTAAARQQQYLEDRASLNNLPNKSPFLVALLAEANAKPNVEVDRVAKLPDGRVVRLNGLGVRLREAVEAREVSASASNALLDYTRSYALLPPEFQAQSVRPDSLRGESAERIKTALSAMNTLLGGASDLDGIRLASSADEPLKAALNAGNGTDTTGSCAPPSGLYASFWFPLKNFLSPIKDQGRRGTCWAFTTVAALDSREAVQRGAVSNLSEQFLVNKVKRDWAPSDDEDGYNAEKALLLLIVKSQVLPGEAGWTYNRSPSRPDDSYANSCAGYSGTCSDTAHQSERVCTTFIFDFCGYRRVTFGGPGVGANLPVQAWSSGDTFDLDRYRNLLANGHALMASFTVYRGFMDDASTGDGYVTNFAAKKLEGGVEVDGSYGGHAVLLVGYVDNLSISANPLLQNIPPAPGGGYFIAKNSWGCVTPGGSKVGDSGYWYVPVKYVQDYFNRLSYLDFDAQRSEAWTREQAAPGGGASITVKANPSRADLRVRTDVSQWFTVTHPVARSVDLRVSTDRGENIYQGNWNVGSGVFGQNLFFAFDTPGPRTVTVVARAGTIETRSSFITNVVNTSPIVMITSSGTARQGEPFPLAASIADPNEPDLSLVCAATHWSVDAPDVLSVGTGCQVSVRFGATGSRQVRVSTQDRDGAPASASATFSVQAPPVNPYPRITAAGVFGRDFVGGLLGCANKAVPSGQLIDLRDVACNAVTLPRYFAEVTVENPQNEALTYTWTLRFRNTITGRTDDVALSGATRANLSVKYGGPFPCSVIVQVNAPEPARSKQQTVWSGQCDSALPDVR